MISIVKGKAEISLNLQGMLSLHFPLPLTVAEGKDRSENGLSDKARRNKINPSPFFKKPQYVEFVDEFPVKADGSLDRAAVKLLYGKG